MGVKGYLSNKLVWMRIGGVLVCLFGNKFCYVAGSSVVVIVWNEVATTVELTLSVK